MISHSRSSHGKFIYSFIQLLRNAKEEQNTSSRPNQKHHSHGTTNRNDIPIDPTLDNLGHFKGDWGDGGTGHGVGDDDDGDWSPAKSMAAAMTTMGMKACNRLVDFFCVFLYLLSPLLALSLCNLSIGSHLKALTASREILPLLPPNIYLQIIQAHYQRVLNS